MYIGLDIECIDKDKDCVVVVFLWFRSSIHLQTLFFLHILQSPFPYSIQYNNFFNYKFSIPIPVILALGLNVWVSVESYNWMTIKYESQLKCP